MRKITYSSNNSGGYWWLSTDKWIALEKAGWYVIWGGKLFCHSEWSPMVPPICSAADVCHGHRKFDSHDKMTDKDLWSGCHAKEAYIITSKTMEETINDWERITGENAEDEGCNCCGQPHYFDEEEDE